MSVNFNRKSIFTGLIWRFAERCGTQGVTLIVSIILARILEPSDYGNIALVTVFITILNVFVDGGLANSLIQKKDSDEKDFSTVFFFNILLCVLLYVLIYVSAPYISEFYEQDELTSVIRVLSLIIVISGIKNVQHAYVSKYLLFKKFFWSTLVGTVFAAIIGICLAYRGWGIWSLVVQQITSVFIGTIMLWLTVEWRPSLYFSFSRLKGLYGYGWKILLSSLLETLSNELRTMLIGKVYTSSDLAYYNQGQKFPSVIVTNINVSIDSVIFPAMSSVQDDRDKVKIMTRRAIKIGTFIMAPMMIGLAFMADVFVVTLLTDKWLFCVPYLRVFCITYMFYPLHTSNLNAIKAIGRSDIILKLQIIKKIIDLLLVIFCINISLDALALSMFISCALGLLINSWPNRKLLQYTFEEQLRDILPNILLAVFMGIWVYFVGFLPLSSVLVFLIQILTGIIFYVSTSMLLKNESFIYMYKMLKTMIVKNKEI